MVALGSLPLAAARAALPPAAGGWRTLPSEPYQRKQDDIFFATPARGWYGNGGGKLFTTADGGESWTRLWEQSGTFVRALGFIDEQNGFLGNLGVGPSPRITDPHPLYRTRDGGESWTPIATEFEGSVKGICSIDILPRRVIFQGEVQMRHLVHAAGRAFGPATILRSEDGGESWRLIDLSRQAGMILDVRFLDMNNGFVCAATSNDLEQSNASILRTRDAGATWQSVYRSARPLELCWKLSFPSRRIGYATVQNNDSAVARQVVIKTSDGGCTWRELRLCHDSDAKQFGIGFVSEQRGWVGTATGGLETRDGGRSWRPSNMGESVNKIRVLRDSNRFTAYAIGRNVARYDG